MDWETGWILSTTNSTRAVSPNVEEAGGRSWPKQVFAPPPGPSSLADYGQLKLPAWHLLMALAESWARDTGWDPDTFPRERHPFP